jgi:glycosyltransferase involved in cell wall biosynthesis
MSERNLSPRRLHLLLPFPVLGAAEDYGLTIAQGMAQRGWDVTVAHSHRVDPAIDAGVVRKAPIDTNSPLAIKRWLAAEKPELLHVNQVFLPALGITRFKQIHPTVVTSHTPALRIGLSRRGRVLQFYSQRGVDRWIVLSERNRKLMAGSHRIAPGAISAIYPGLPEERFHTLPDRHKARASLSIGPTETVVGTVGRLSEQKRHDVLIEAMARASRQVADLRLVIVGDGELSGVTRKLAEQQIPGRVVFTGHRTDVTQLLPGFDVFAMSSDFEGLPFALLEAMATGRAIVTTDVQGAGEAVRDSLDGFVVPRRDPDALAAGIVTIARDKELGDRLGRSAYERFLAEFTADRMVNRTEALYLDLLAARKSQR